MIFAVLALLLNTARADELAISYGLGIAESAVGYAAETKIFTLNYRQMFSDSPFYLSYDGGLWVDSSGISNRKSSGFIGASPGFKVDFYGFEVRNAYGIALISDTDSYLGGHFQFHGELYTGFRDPSTKFGIGIKYNHFSSAGLYAPNVGRDFLLLELSTQF